MTQKQISDLTATDRLRTGTQLELQDPTNGSGNITIDNMLLGPNWDTPSQVAGYTVANIMEVEATLAARMRLCPDEVNLLAAGWQIGRYMYSSGNYPVTVATPPVYCALTTTGPANSPISLFSWACMGGFAVIKKVTATLVIGARSSGLAGACDMRMLRAYGLSTQIGATLGSIGSPGSQGGSGVTGLVVNATTNGAGQSSAGTGGLKTNQQPSQAHIQAFSSVSVAAAQAFVDAQAIGIIEGSVPVAAGSTPIQNGVLYDWQVAEQPLILTPGTGFQINLNAPGAGTSQTIFHWLNFQWDEWLPVAPGDR